MRAILAVLILLTGPEILADDRFAVELEAGPVWQLRNDFAVPGTTGTLVRLEEQGPFVSARATLLWRVSDRWTVRVLAAPLSTESDFTPAEDIAFEDATFEAGVPLRADYRFDSYRVSGIYNFPSAGRWSFRLGGTLKLRDAEITLSDGGRVESKSNTGLVPLLYGAARATINDRLALDFEADAAAAPQGRAIDALARLEIRTTETVMIFAGARVLDGGADNDEVYSFGQFVYAVAGARIVW
jgi:hypothetical protein